MTKPLTHYRADIDGLRAVAVLAVVLNHLSATWVSGGYVGVDVFFVISGYLITTIIHREMTEGRFTFGGFYARRVRRIFPALFAMLAATLVASYFILLPSDFVPALRAALGTLFFASNLEFWVTMKEGYFAALDTRLNPLLHTWSLSVEEQFYLLFPAFMLLCYRWFPRHLFWILLGCALVSFAGAVVLAQTNQVAAFFLSPFRAWELLAGSLLAFKRVPAVRSAIAREALAAAGLVSITVSCFVFDDGTTFPGLAALAPVLGAAAIIHAGASGATVAGSLLRWRPVVYIGLISYSLYLWHWPVIVLAQYANGMEPLTPWLPALFAACLLLASLSYHFVEKPFRRHGISTIQRFALPSGALLGLGLAVFSVAGMVNGGFTHRFEPKVVMLDKARSADIPYVECVGRTPQEGCVLGASGSQPTTLLWGDSHMLAWAPALHKIFSQKGESAILATLYACPPLLEVKVAINPRCEASNLAIQDYLVKHPDIKTVVMAAFWSTYFRQGGPLTQAGAGMGTAVSGMAAAQSSLGTTLQWLGQGKRQVLLIGPVPLPDKDVPLALALNELTGRGLVRSTANRQRELHEEFLDVAKAARPASGFQFADPIAWLCTHECLWAQGEVSLYRDEHHLSIAGAMALKPHLALTLDKLGIAPAPGALRAATKHGLYDLHRATFTLGEPLKPQTPRF